MDFILQSDGEQSVDKGYHLILDAFSSDAAKLNDGTVISNCLEQIILLAGMKKIGGPYTNKYTDCPTKESGITSLVMLAESDAAIHTYPYKNYLAFSLFSCKAFDTDKIIRYLKDELSLTKIAKRTLIRGLAVIDSR